MNLGGGIKEIERMQKSDHETESMLLVENGEQNQGPPDAGVPQGTLLTMAERILGQRRY